MWEQLRRFRALEPRARQVFLRAAVLLPLISLSLRLRGFRATQGALQKWITAWASKEANAGVAAANGGTLSNEDVERTARMVRAAARHGWPNATCLENSLALWWLLGRQGIASEMRIGARKAGGKFEAHAWVECDGGAVSEIEEVHHHYAAFDQAFSSLAAGR